jgi:hypothetical protein
MAYFIPRGTPIEIQQGERVQQNITSDDLCFLEPAIDKPNELVFTDGRTYILVAKALVIGRSDDSRSGERAALDPGKCRSE